MTVLFVDDDPDVLAALCRTLRRQPYRVVATSRPEKALEMVVAEQVDIVVSDVDMPGINGVELVSRLKARHPEVIRILLTGRGDLSTAMKAINEGEVFRFLTKPWDLEEFIAVIDEAAARRRELQETAAASAGSSAAILEELERAHPGITAVERPNGVYVISEKAMLCARRFDFLNGT